MDFLVELETDRQKRDELKTLERRKVKLQQQLKKLENELTSDYMCMDNTPQPRKRQDDAVQLKQTMDAYRMIGLTTDLTTDDFVLQFSPVYKKQHSSTDFYSAQIGEREGSQYLGQHNLPPFIPVKQLEETYLGNGKMKEFVEHIQSYLYAYAQRRDGLKEIKTEYITKGIASTDANLPVTFVRVVLDLGQDLPAIVVELTYDLNKTLPDSVNLQIDESEEIRSKEKKRLEKLITQWKQQLIHKDIYSAFTSICSDL